MKAIVELEREVLSLLAMEAMRAVHELRRATNPSDHTLGAQEDRRRAMLLEDAVVALNETMAKIT
jgi:hypothetical protein